MSSKSQSNNDSAAPLYITIGPMCSGKSTYLSKSKEKIVDICIDDQQGMYHPIPYSLFLNPAVDLDRSTRFKRSKKRQKLNESHDLNKVVHNSSVKDRISCPTQKEMKIVLKYLTSNQDGNPNLTEMDLKAQLQSLKEELQDIAKSHSTSTSKIPLWKMNYPFDLMQDFIDAFSSIKGFNYSSASETKTEFSTPNSTVDLFIFEALFNPPDLALKKAISLLDHPEGTSKLSKPNGKYIHAPIAWGNTNTKPRDYEAALKSAERQGRPVHFIIFDAFGKNYFHHDSKGKITILSKNLQRMHWELPHLSRKELFQRNLKRFCATGRYINIMSLDGAIKRCKDLLYAAQNEMISSEHKFKDKMKNKFALDKALAKLAGYDMHPDRKVIKLKSFRPFH